jgi:hypothetical protein
MQRRFRLELTVYDIVGIPPAVGTTPTLRFKFWRYGAEVLRPHGDPTTRGDVHVVSFAAVKTCTFLLTEADERAMVEAGPPLLLELVDSRGAVASSVAIRVPTVDASAAAAPATKLVYLMRDSQHGTGGNIEIACRVVREPAGAGTAGGQLGGTYQGAARVYPGANEGVQSPSKTAPAHGDSAPIVVKVRLHDKAGGGLRLHNEPVGSDGSVRVHEALRGVATKRTLLYLLQYKVCYQVKSCCDNLVAVLKREHARLNTPPAAVAKVAFRRLVKAVHRILRDLNIAVQLASQLHGSGAAFATMDPVPANNLPTAAKGSVAELLQFDVLYQLQGAAAQAAHVIAHDRDRLEIPIATLAEQHAAVFRRLPNEVNQLTRNVNVIVQATVDGALEAYVKAKDMGGAADDYSDSEFDSKSSSSSSSSDSSTDEDVVQKQKPSTAAAVAVPAASHQQQVSAPPIAAVASTPAKEAAQPVAPPVPPPGPPPPSVQQTQQVPPPPVVQPAVIEAPFSSHGPPAPVSSVPPPLDVSAINASGLNTTTTVVA